MSFKADILAEVHVLPTESGGRRGRTPADKFGCPVSWLLCIGLIGSLVQSLCAQSYGLNSRPAIGPYLNGTLPNTAPTVSGNWSAVVAFTNLTFVNAVGLLPLPGTTKLVVWEREGRAYAFDNQPGATTKTLLLDVTNQCQAWNDCGFLGLAFHPGFVTNRFGYVWYNWVPPGTPVGNSFVSPDLYLPNRIRLSRFTFDSNNVALPGSELVLIDQNQVTIWHNGGGICFGGDGFLYVTVGDNFNTSNEQRIDGSLHGGVLRVDVDQRGGAVSHPIPRQPHNGTTANYYIPNDNPFVGQAGVLEEFFAIGLRSPHRMTYDTPSRRFFIGDVGEGLREEIDVIEPTDPFGLNFQWNLIEGFQGDLSPPYLGVNKPPILDYSHRDGAAVIGGYVYRGSQFAPDLGGKYIFGDFFSRTIWALNEGTIPAGKTELCVMPAGLAPDPNSDYPGLTSFGVDAAGEIYLCQFSSAGGRIYKLSRGGPTNLPLPRLLSQTSAFTNLATLGSALIPYDVASPLWSDGAVKRRWMSIPAGQTIDFFPTGEWTFPNGSVFVKHFELPVDDTNPSVRRRLETRLLVRDSEGAVYGATYKWRADNSDADLLDSSVIEEISVRTAAGQRTQQWYYPSRTDCLACHSTAARGVLGVKTRQLNRDFYYEVTGRTDNQLRTWSHIGLFAAPPAESAIVQLDQLVAVTNTMAPLEKRVRSYLDANCSHCHRPGGVRAFWDARFDTPLDLQGIVYGPVADDLGRNGARVVVPGDLAHSILFLRANSIEAGVKMPPLARSVVDSSATATIADWILAYPPEAPVTVHIEPDSSTSFHLWFLGLDDRSYVLEASSDLRGWIPIRTNSASGGRLDFIGPIADPARFFRARSIH